MCLLLSAVCGAGCRVPAGFLTVDRGQRTSHDTHMWKAPTFTFFSPALRRSPQAHRCGHNGVRHACLFLQSDTGRAVFVLWQCKMVWKWVWTARRRCNACVDDCTLSACALESILTASSFQVASALGRGGHARPRTMAYAELTGQESSTGWVPGLV